MEKLLRQALAKYEEAVFKASSYAPSTKEYTDRMSEAETAKDTVLQLALRTTTIRHDQEIAVLKAKIEAIATDFVPSNDSEYPQALQGMRDALMGVVMEDDEGRSPLLLWSEITPGGADKVALTAFGDYVISVDEESAGGAHHLWLAGEPADEDPHGEYRNMADAIRAADAHYRILIANS
jgi:hypothetical protein